MTCYGTGGGCSSYHPIAYQDHSTTVDNTKQLRNTLRAQRKSLSNIAAKQAAQQASQQLIALTEFQQASSIACYIPINGEMDTDMLIKSAWQKNKAVYLPLIQADSTLLFVPFQADTVMLKNKFGIPEPQSNATNGLNACSLDLVITPLVAFNKNCHRIGMGGGYYDRTFANCPSHHPIKIGFAYDFQCVNSIVNQPWDIPMDWVITDKGCYKR